MPKIIEHFRHALRTKPSPHLNQTGVRIARKQGKDFGPYDLVVTSPKRRAVETAVAMGFAVHETLNFLEDIPEDVNNLIPYDAGFEKFAAAIETHPLILNYLSQMRKELIAVLERVPKNGKLMLVSHGGVVEWSALAFVPDAANWGLALDKSEGVRLEFRSSGKISGEPIRLSQIR